VLPLPDKPSIAVLPFANMSGDPEQEYFVDGMVEEIITALSALRADCGTLSSEDMQDGMVIEGRLRVANPFRATN
jgi:predicted nucleic acid-binding protein